FSGYYYVVGSEDHQIRSRSLWDQDLGVSSLEAGERVILRDAGPQGQRLLVAAGGYEKQGALLTIAVAEDLSAVEKQIRDFQIIYGGVSLALLVFLILLQRWIVRAGLAPVENARKEVAALERGEIFQIDENAPAEVRPFIREINQLLDAMRRRLKRSRNALGNLAHALKGPLSILVQLGDREELKRHPEIQSELLRQTGLLKDRMDRELKRARLAGGRQTGLPVGLKEEIGYLIDALGKVYREKQVAAKSEIPPTAVFYGDREDFLELLGNLLDNAFKWSKGRVRLTVSEGEGVRLTVEDDGPGCLPEEVERLSRRGERLDETVDGHGLGLSIVREIVEQYSGQIEFGRSESLGGFAVSVSFPPPVSP
ncbi:MAG TPA: sensor histidine kinase, partial [Nitrospiria bacterium]|nr:sensor histidine kinase [Nitrospiria bacterium]